MAGVVLAAAPVLPVGSAAADAGAAGPATAWVVTVAPGQDAEAVDGTVIGPRDVLVEATPADAADLADDPGVVAVERDVPALGAAMPEGADTALRRIGAPTAWQVASGAPSVVVALVDAGVDTAHPDLQGRVTAVTTCTGLDPALGTADRTAAGHGTRVAGVVAGVVPAGVRMRAYTALGPDLRGTTSSVAAAVHCAVDDGADVINLSLTAGDTTAMRNALDRAAAAGVVVVAAAGNGGNGVHPGPYPAAHPSVVAVTAVVEGSGAERRASFANGGPWVDLAAPGTAITSTVPGGGWSTADGTSYAVPFVAGAAALVLATDPTLDDSAVKARLEATAEPLADPSVGRGLLDVSAAVRATVPPGAAVCAAGAGRGWVLDAFGALHPFGGAPPVATGAYWPGWDIARDVVTVPGQGGGYVLDGHGALHAFGGAPAVTSPAYRPGWDVARGADRRADGSVVVVDAQGGLHVAGGGPALGPGGPWWPGTDTARDVAVDPRRPTVAYVLDAWGGVHVAGAGTAPAVVVTRYTPGRDTARRLLVLPSGDRGYVLDAGGRLHPWAAGDAELPPATAAATSGTGPGRAAAVDPASGRVVTVTGGGAVVPVGATPCRPSMPWPGRDLARGLAYG